jgi:gliding motility-associated-like protein
VGTNSPILVNQPPGRYYLVVLDSRVPAQRVTFDAELKIKSTLSFTTKSTPAMDNVSKDGSTKVTITPGVAPYSIRWQDGSTSTTQLDTITNNQVMAGKAEVTVTDFLGCVAKNDVTTPSSACATIRVNTVFVTPKGKYNIQCRKNADGGATVLSLSSDYATPIRSYQWSTGEVGSTAFKLGPEFNQVTITDANGKTCVSRIFMNAPDSLKSVVWVDDKSRTLEVVPTGGIQPYKYVWTTDAKDTTRKVTVNRTGIYYVIVQDFLNCPVTDKGQIIFDASCLDGSAILTPNDDGRNENFRIKSCDYKSVRLEVYNRWGQLVYSKNNYVDNWYGNKEDGPTGDPLPEGVYMYVLSATDVAGKQQLGKGTVNIVRN